MCCIRKEVLLLETALAADVCASVGKLRILPTCDHGVIWRTEEGKWFVKERGAGEYCTRTNAHQPADRRAAPHRDHAQAFCAELELEHDLTEEDDVATPREKCLDQACASNRIGRGGEGQEKARSRRTVLLSRWK